MVERPWLAAVREADGDGDTCGNAEPRLPVGWNPRPGTVPVGRALAGGSVPPSPAFCVDGGEGSFLISTVTDAVAEFDACAEVAVAVNVT